VSRLGDRFVLVRELGSGGVARVYLGRDELLDRPVAVKVLDGELDDPEIGPLFRKEGRTAARLSHPNTVRVYDAGEDEVEGREVSYIVMEYVPGGDLKDLIDRTGPVPEAMLSRLGADVVAGLIHAHERGIIHRDVKPRNILLDGQGKPKLADFGIARAFDSTHETHPGSYLGTAAYSSPEQLRGERITPKSDVYSFGATLYHAAVGRPPFSGNPIEIANQHVHQAPVPPRERGARIGEGFEALILDCLAKDPARRPDTARLQARLLERTGAQAAPSTARRAPAGSAGSDAWAGSASGGAAGPAKAVGVSGFAALKERLGRGGTSDLSGPPERTISLPTRTFRAGSRQRKMLAVLVAALLLLGLVGAGAWALLAQNSAERTGQTSDPASGRQEQGGVAEQKKPEQQPDGEAAGGTDDSPSEDPGSSDDAPQAEAGLVPPLERAERAVFDMYVQESYQTPQTSWVYLSERLQNEVGSPERWAQREQIYTLYYVYFTRVPEATASGDTAEVVFEVRLDRDTGKELLSGTWVCVNEGGEWKLDRLENEKTVPL
jgi:eukaryotic-like serine/threonine-protein kinase